MATLKANGPELLRISRERHIELEESDSISWERVTRVYHANGAVLSKTDVIFRPMFKWDNPKGTRHTWGWKKVVLSKHNKLPVRRANDVLAAIKAGTTGSAQWTVEFESASLNPVEVKS